MNRGVTKPKAIPWIYTIDVKTVHPTAFPKISSSSVTLINISLNIPTWNYTYVYAAYDAQRFIIVRVLVPV